ncbi:MAG: PGF-pre-PGF domain-containing protein [Candidatus Methanoperedens sp.]
MVKIKQNNQKRPFLASTVVTLFIVIMLIISGPAQAVSVSILGLQGPYTQGSSIQFQVKIDINDPDQFVPAKDISLNLTGPTNPSAVFSLDGKKVSGDSIIKITGFQIPQASDFGYGYGYGKDSFGYGYGYESFGYGYGYGYGKITDFGYGYGYGRRTDSGYGYGYNTGYGYGYGYGYNAGYGYGNLTYIYNVTIETATLPVGDYNVVASLRAENNAVTKIFTSATGQFTITPASTTSSGGSSGSTGGGVVSSEPFDNVESSEIVQMDLLANQSVTYRFSTVPRIYEVAVVGKEYENAVSLRVEALKGTSRLVTAAPDGIVSKNMNIFSSSSGIKDALIRFKVENSWMENNSLSSGDMKMVKWDGSKWVQLETTEKNKDSTYTYFETNTTSFSNFAITGLKGAVAGATSRVTPTVTRSGITPAVPGVTPTTPTAAPTNFSLIAIVVVILIVIGVAVYLRRK